MRIVFQRLKEFSLRINVSKCEFGKSELEFLGYKLNNEGSFPTLDKVRAITNFARPKTIVELRRFLGMVNFYRRNLRHAAEVQAPLQKFMREFRKNDKRLIRWDSEAESAFERVKSNLVNANLVSHPARDAPTRIVSDATEFDLEELRREIAARSSVSLQDYIPGLYKFVQLGTCVALRLSRSLYIVLRHCTPLLAANF